MEGARLDDRFIAYLGITTLLIVTPGPDTALVTRNAVSLGWDAASFTSVGVAVGILGWAVASALGLGIIVEQSAIVFTLIKIAGAAYLGYLGLRGLVGRGTHRDLGQSTGRARVSSGDHRVAFQQGLLCNLTNPKAGMIFVSMLPQFIHPSVPFPRVLLMLVAFEAILLIWLNVYGYLVSRVGQTRRGARARHTLERVTGLFLLGMAVHLLIENQ
jgi:threonine/homoserine/homoserine lactone efflux protein